MRPEFEIAGQTYRFDGMPGVAETHVFRRFAPLIADALPLVVRRGRKPGVPIELRRDADFVRFAAAVFQRWGMLSDADVGAIHRAALGALSRQMGADWHTVWRVGEAEPAFPDLNGALIMRLTQSSLGHVVRQWFETVGDGIPDEILAFVALLRA